MQRPAKLLAPALLLVCVAVSLAGPSFVASAQPAATQASHARVRQRDQRGCAAHSRRNSAAACRALARRRHAHSTLKARQLARTPSRAAAQSRSTGHAAVAEQRAAALAAALSAPCANTELIPEEGNITLVRAAVLCLINRERAENDVAPLALSQQLEAAAAQHARELIADDYFAHISPSGETPVDRIRATGYIPGPSVGYVIGENLAWGTYSLSSAQSIVAAWIASPGHLANILEAKYTETGVGIASAVPASLANGAPGATYAQEFGVIVP